MSNAALTTSGGGDSVAASVVWRRRRWASGYGRWSPAWRPWLRTRPCGRGHLPADGLRRHNREQSQVQRRTASSRQPAAEAGDQDRRPPRWTGPPAVTPSGQGRRPVGALMSRCRPGTRQRAARTRPQVRAGQRGPRLGSTARWADGAASRRGRCAPCPATGRVIRAQAFPNAPRVCRPIAKRFVTPHAAQRRPCGVTQAQRRRRTQRGRGVHVLESTRQLAPS